MSRLSIRWLLLGVAGASLLLPLLAFLLLRSLDPYLVQQTERQLHAEAALIAESYRSLWSEASGLPLGNPRPTTRQQHSFMPVEPQIRDLGELSPQVPTHFPGRSRPKNVEIHGEGLSQSLRSAQIFNLSGVRVLDDQGCAVASSRAQLDSCFGVLPEVAKALDGRYATAIRLRSSDEPTPPVGSLRRRGDLRVFVAHPVFNAGQVIGAIWLSRTAESGLEFLVKQRRGLFYGGLSLMGSVILVSALFAGLIIRPLRLMAASASALSRGESPPPLSAIVAPAEVHELGAAFDVLTDRLQARARYASEFAANISHELKTPLTSIRGALELLREQGAAMDEPQRERFLTNMDAAAERTERLVTRLLLLARLENPSDAGAPATEPLAGWLAPQRDRAGADVEFSASEAALASLVPVFELDAVVGNLVDNALRFRRRAPVRVGFAHDDDKLCVTVEDDGAGISPHNRARLFERFFTTERDRGGTGLGLAIVKAIAEARGGSVEIWSSPAGTRVQVWM